jgi:DNA invertase Pin-like site-specific DNA recombinase
MLLTLFDVVVKNFFGSETRIKPGFLEITLKLSKLWGILAYMTTTKKMMGIYCRISRLKEDGKDKSIHDQKQLGIELANKLGYDYSLYIDEGLSAASDNIEDRPEFKRFMDDMAQDTFHAIFGYDQSRFERNPMVRNVFVATVREHVKEYYTEIDGLVDLHDPQVEFISNIMSAINQYQVTMTSHKVKSVLKRNAREGRAQGLPPYGYSTDENGFIVVDEEEGSVIRRIFDLTLKGHGTRVIANKLNDDNILTRYAKHGEGVIKIKNRYTEEIVLKDKKEIKWSPNTIRTILRNSWFIGERNYKGEVLKVPSIVSEKDWGLVQDLLDNRTNKSKQTYEYLLKGKLRCAKCGRNYYGRTRKDKSDHTYICSSRRTTGGNCGNRGINIDRLEELVWYRIINSPLFLKALKRDFNFSGDKKNDNSEKLETVNKALKAVEERRKRIVTAYSNGVLEESDLQGQLVEITTEKARLEGEIEVIESKQVITNISGEMISQYEDFQMRLNHFRDNLTFEERREIIHLFVKNIKIDYDDEVGGYHLDIDYLIHPSEFDKDYPEDYGNGDHKLMPKRELTTPFSSYTPDTVWCGLRKGLSVTRPVLLVSIPATE